jgi:hypothetical protein
MRCYVSRSLALVRAVSGVLGWVNNRKLTQGSFPSNIALLWAGQGSNLRPWD